MKTKMLSANQINLFKENRPIFRESGGAIDKLLTVANPLAEPEKKANEVFADTSLIVPWSKERVEHGAQMTLKPSEIASSVKTGIKGILTSRFKDVKNVLSIATALPTSIIETKSPLGFIKDTKDKISSALGDLLWRNRKEDLKNVARIALNTTITPAAYVASQALWATVHPVVRLAGSAGVATATYASELADKPVELINRLTRRANSVIAPQAAAA